MNTAEIKKSHSVEITELPNLVKRRMNRIFRKVCKLFEKNPKEIYRSNDKQFRELVEIRQISFFIIRKKYPEYTYSQIAFFFDKDNHATIIHGIKTVNNLLETNRQFREKTNPLFN